MSRISRTGNGGSARKLVAVHQQAGQYRLLTAETRGGSVAVLDARSLREADLAGAISALLREHKPERIVRIAPGSRTLCRGVEMPVGDESGLAAALGLMAEAELPENLPSHRRAAGIIPGEGREGGRIALLTGWRPDREGTPKPLTTTIEERWVTEVACLAVLRGDHGAAIYADRKDGAIAILASGSRRTVARILVEEAGTQAMWRSAVERSVEETLQAAGARAPMPEATDIILHLPEQAVTALAGRIKGARAESRWMAEYGLALGAVLVASDDPLTAGLADLRAAGDIRREPVLLRATRWLGDKRRARMVTAASVALLLLGPLGLAAARLAVLEHKSEAVESARLERRRLDEQTALYAQLEQGRWPMSKLLGDIAAATPVGVVIDDFRLGADMGLTLQGSADDLDKLHTLQQNLSSSGIFRNVKLNRSDVSASRVSFDVAADVLRPHAAARRADDFAATPLAVRLHGEGASNTTTPMPSRRQTPATDIRGVSRENGDSAPPSEPRSESGRERMEAESSRRPSTATPVAESIPPALTDEQIAAMDRSTAMKEWVARRTYTQRNQGMDPGEKQRLEHEAAKLQERMKAAAAGGGS